VGISESTMPRQHREDITVEKRKEKNWFLSHVNMKTNTSLNDSNNLLFDNVDSAN
jgi:hypothetical protein